MSLALLIVEYLDRDVLAEVAATSNRPEFIAEMLDYAIKDIERSAEPLMVAIAHERWNESRAWAHAIKGAADQIGAFRLKSAAIAIMQADSSNLRDSRSRIIAEFSSAYAGTLGALRDAGRDPLALRR